MAKFIGEEAGAHLHIEGRSHHFKFGTNNGSRKDYSPDEKDPFPKTKEAFTELKKYSGKPGYEACMKYFKKIYGWS